MTLANARLWFRYRWKIIDHIKGNKSLKYKNNMACRLCTSGENETQEYLEKFEFTKDRRKNLDLEIRDDKIVLWRKITRALKDIYEPKKDVNKLISNSIDKTINPNKGTKDCGSTPNPAGQGDAPPAPSEMFINVVKCSSTDPRQYRTRNIANIPN